MLCAWKLQRRGAGRSLPFLEFSQSRAGMSLEGSSKAQEPIHEAAFCQPWWPVAATVSVGTSICWGAEFGSVRVLLTPVGPLGLPVCFSGLVSSPEAVDFEAWRHIKTFLRKLQRAIRITVGQFLLTY